MEPPESLKAKFQRGLKLFHKAKKNVMLQDLVSNTYRVASLKHCKVIFIGLLHVLKIQTDAE